MRCATYIFYRAGEHVAILGPNGQRGKSHPAQVSLRANVTRASPTKPRAHLAINLDSFELRATLGIVDQMIDRDVTKPYSAMETC